MRIGDFKVLRRQLKTKKPGPWEVYNIATDRNETTDLAAGREDLIRQAREILAKENAPNAAFSLTIPD